MEEKFLYKIKDFNFFMMISVQDVVAVLKLKQKYPDRVFMTRFEKLASDPVQISKEIYKFLDLEFTDKVERFVQSKTHSKQSGRGYSNDRTDAKGKTIIFS